MVTSGRRANQSGDMMDGTDLGLIGIGAGIVGLLIAAMLYKKVDSIKIENETVAKICLLYTSPSPRDATLSRMPSSA